jgi:TPR repeat protein
MPAVGLLFRAVACAVPLVACGGTLRTPPTAPPPEVSLCVTATDEGGECRFGKLAECERRCACKDWDACARLGFMYDASFAHDIAWRPDPARALDLYKLACAGGSNSGCYDLANAYEQGVLVPASVEMAREMFERTCQLGYVAGCVRLGKLELRIDRSRGLAALRRACKVADAEGCFLLGSALVEGKSSEERQEGFSALTTACTRPRSLGTNMFAQADVSRFSERACEKWRDLQPSRPQSSP